ncbi:conserved hypothetical protein [Neospora caninum Liverpool]|uniref:Transmembrane protein n=1 Tax=Neospora caninum (strain Liverpool) TaxID=572307 RepID=F0VQV9_NEOCL|nr:conserved hypothetical protein [Neospora caninum Liverpool]CBZ56106.1 conserved hypothetical protein [Neospora caninum Liverpool]CEL70861.1 TPA: hypothetical protein BN1204_065320 [Neospora caninum Liverpool]|eukprot:XP_003886132.1 conserved hypothetical protein [Neospora caninum Liverpool]
MTAPGGRESIARILTVVAVCAYCLLVVSSDAASSVYHSNSYDVGKVRPSPKPPLGTATQRFFRSVDLRKGELYAGENVAGRKRSSIVEGNAFDLSPLRRRAERSAALHSSQTPPPTPHQTTYEGLSEGRSQITDRPDMEAWPERDRRSEDLSVSLQTSTGSLPVTNGVVDDDVSVVQRHIRRKAAVQQGIMKAGLAGGTALSSASILYGLSRHLKREAAHRQLSTSRENAARLGLISTALAVASAGTLVTGGWMWLKKIRKAHAIAAKQQREAAKERLFRQEGGG